MADQFRTILADPPWRYQNRRGKISPEHGRLHRYQTMGFEDICRVGFELQPRIAPRAHLYLWVPIPLSRMGHEVMDRWGFEYRTTIVWEKVRADGKPDGRCCGFYYRVAAEFLLFGIRGSIRTKPPWNRTNIIRTMKREHSRKPDEAYRLIEQSSYPDYLELFARHRRPGWTQEGIDLEPSHD